MEGPPTEFQRREVVRFEGDSDPGDEACLFALVHRPSGKKGPYPVTYGPEMGPDDAAVARPLH